MENILKGSHPKMTGQNDRQEESLTGQVHNQAGHCPLTGRYFEPCQTKKVNSHGHILFSLLALLFVHQSGQSFYIVLEC